MILPRSLPRRRTPCATAEQPKTRPPTRPKPPTRQKRSWGQCGACGHPPPLPPVVGGCPTTAAPLRPPCGGLRPPSACGLWGRAASPAHGHRARPMSSAGGLRAVPSRGGGRAGAIQQPQDRGPYPSNLPTKTGGPPPPGALPRKRPGHARGIAPNRGPYPEDIRGGGPYPRSGIAARFRRPTSGSGALPLSDPLVATLLRGLASARGASAPYKHTRASARGASARIALGPRGASCSEDSPSHRRRGRRLLRLDMRTLAHVCAPRLTWASVRTTALPARSRTRRPAPVRLGSFRFRPSARSPSLASGCLALGNARKLADLGRRCLQKRSGSEIRAD